MNNQHSSSHAEYKYDVFISYRWVEPDQTWVRGELVPALQASGLTVCIDVEDFVPGRDLILEMNRAGEESRALLCILSPAYFEGNRMVAFESLAARRSDPSGKESCLVPLILRHCNLPNWIRGLIPVDWTDRKHITREWKKVLRVLAARQLETQPPGICVSETLPEHGQIAPSVIWIHDYLIPANFVGRDQELSQIQSAIGTHTGDIGLCRVFAITAIGGVGKSALARMAVARKQLLANFTRVVWFSFYEARTEDEGYFFDEILDALGLPIHTQTQGTERIVKLRKTLCKAIDSNRFLLILDGLEVIQTTGNPEAPNYGKIVGGHKETMRFIKHVLNAHISSLIVTTRVRLRDCEGSAAYHELTLQTLPSKAAVDFLKRAGVSGSEPDFKRCASLFGGHPLCLRAASEYMVRRRLPANQIEELTGDGKLFESSSDGEKIKKIVDQFRKELTASQEHFLKMLSLHPRSVSAANFPVLIADFESGGFDENMLKAEIIVPLSEMGLIDVVETVHGNPGYSSHPLMKLAYSSWLLDSDRTNGHKVWARAAEEIPVTYTAGACNSLTELQPFVDATNQYLNANEVKKAWKIFEQRGTGERLDQLGCFAQCFEIAKRFELTLETAPDSLGAEDKLFLFDRLARVTRRLDMGSDAVKYRTKLVEVAKGTFYIDQCEDFLVLDLLALGQVKKAEKCRCHSADTKATIDLYKGHYRSAASYFGKAFPKKLAHDKTVCGARLGEALSRDGRVDEAEKILLETLGLSRSNHFTCCELSLLETLVMLELKRSCTSKAREFQTVVSGLRERLGLDVKENAFLLVAESELELALDNLETDDNDDCDSKIRNSLIECAVYIAQNRRAEASALLKQAEELMKGSGCLRHSDVAENLRIQLRDI